MSDKKRRGLFSPPKQKKLYNKSIFKACETRETAAYSDVCEDFEREVSLPFYCIRSNPKTFENRAAAKTTTLWSKKMPC